LQSDNSDQSIINQSVDEKLFRLLIASVQDYAIFMIDPNGYILSWNQGAANIKGYNEKEIIGKHISVFYTANDNKKNESRHNLNKALKYGAYETEGWRVKKDGSVFWANVVFTTLYNNNGYFIGFAKVTRDITERKRNEDKKEELNAELERRVKENTKKNNYQRTEISQVN
jgi:PAS domain S-box-containing protein